MKNKFDKVKAVGRDHTKGLLAFRTGAHLTRVMKLNDRNNKFARKEKREQLDMR